MYSQKYLAQPHFQIQYQYSITKYLQSIIIIFCLECMIFWIEKYSTRFSHFDVSMRTIYFQRKYVIGCTVIILWRICISGLELQRWSVEFVISFLKIHVWDLRGRFGYFLFWGHVIQIFCRVMNFHDINSQP
jgi:hypothetical protein